MKTVLVFLFSFIVVEQSYGQDFSNKGTDFWVGYSTHVAMYSSTGTLNTTTGGSQNLVLYFTSDQAANVKVEIPATGWVRTYTVSPNSITETTTIPKTGADDARLGVEGVSNKGIHITSDKPIVAYAHNYDGAVSGATLLFPTATLGQDYYVLGITQTSNNNYSYPFCFAIATEDSTIIEVTPSASTLNHPAGVPFTQTLQKGQILNLFGQLTGGSGANFTAVDLTGTRIRSISNGTSGCKRIAVFCGSGKLNIKCSANTSSADNTIQQCFPSTAWGKKYLTVPTKDMPTNIFRIMVNDPSTVVKQNGAVLSGLIANRYYQIQSNTTNLIEADKPIMVAQFISTTGQCGNTFIAGNGDPEMIYLSSVEQTINKITLNSTPRAAINANYHYINVVMKASGVSSFTLDGAKIASNFLPLPNDPVYSYAQIKTSAGIHNLQADSGFNAIAYGYGNAESYGYNAGTNVIDLYQFVSLKNQYATANFPGTCSNTPFNFSITLPYKATALTWSFNNNANLSPNATIVNNSPVPDSTFIRDGRTLNVYTLPGAYAFNAVGVYPIKIIANNPSPDGCPGTQEINYDVNVFDPPVADYNINNSGCIGDAVQFSDISTNARPIIKWIWDFGDNTTDSVRSPFKTFNVAGTYNVNLKSISDVGCIAEITKPVSISPQPLAKFDVQKVLCVGSSITFSDSSTISSGTIVKWNWNFGDNTPIVVNTSASQVTHVFDVAGTYTVSLEVESSTGCKSIVFTKSIVINPFPVADFSFPNVCLPSGQAQFTNLSTIADGTQSSFSYLWDFGDGGNSTLKDPLHIYTSASAVNVKLTVTSGNGCIKDTIKLLNTIYPQPKASFTVNPEVCLGDSIVFTDASNGNGSNVINWRWTFG
ncbi:MAG TPA: PKD domain-containing protein, partial [Segetibacter sp.]